MCIQSDFVVLNSSLKVVETTSLMSMRKWASDYCHLTMWGSIYGKSEGFVYPTEAKIVLLLEAPNWHHDRPTMSDFVALELGA